MLQEKGILDPKLLDTVWQDRRQDNGDLTILLVKFGFLVPLLRQVEATDTLSKKQWRGFKIKDMSRYKKSRDSGSFQWGWGLQLRD